MAKWQELCDELIDRLASGGDRQKAYRNADAEMIRRTTRGQGPDSDSAKPEAGVRVVYNIPAVHVPALVAAGALSKKNRPFKNRYDLGKGGGQIVRLGEAPLRILTCGRGRSCGKARWQQPVLWSGRIERGWYAI